MTDIERKRIDAICKVANINDIEDLSDGFHTFRQLYYQRMMLFATIVKQNRDKAWKSLRHEDGELCFGGEWFIVGIDTPEGSYTYHYEINYYSLFDCQELERAKHWDGHTEKDVTRLLSLPDDANTNADTISTCRGQQNDDYILRQDAIDAMKKLFKRIPTNAIRAEHELNQIPSVIPKKKTGKWIDFSMSIKNVPAECCGECGTWSLDMGKKYCPECGSYNGGKDERDE